jgi:Na+/melibiose symporter-like transporter
MWTEYRGILGDHQYLVLSVVNLLIWMTVSVLQSSLVLYLRHVLGLPDGAFQKTISELQAGVFGGLILFIFINARFSINKTFLLKLTLVVWIGVCGMLSVPNLIEVGAIGFGACIVWAMLLTQSMIPDVITHAQHSRMSGVRRDASYFALFAVFQKLGIGLSLAVVNVALGTAGFESNKTEQPPAVARALAGLFQLFPPAMLALALCILTQYTVTSDAYRPPNQRGDAPQTELEFLDI